LLKPGGEPLVVVFEPGGVQRQDLDLVGVGPHGSAQIADLGCVLAALLLVSGGELANLGPQLFGVGTFGAVGVGEVAPDFAGER